MAGLPGETATLTGLAPLERIRLAVLARDIPAGGLVDEAAIADALGLSRTPVREALAELGGGGLLVRERNRGYRTPAFAVQDVRDFFEAAGALYPAVFAAAARRRTDDDIAALDALLDAAAAEDAVAAYRARIHFYRGFVLGIAEATRNRFHTAPMAALVDAHVMIRIDFARSADAGTRETEMHRNLAVYRELARAVAAGDADLAAETARARLDASRGFIMGEILGG